MKLISCHIENYGAISNTDFKLNDTLTAFCEKNGYGKTTIASFLKAMFYGMDSDRSNSDFNERRHFYPFSGGSFGGNVTFEANGKTYKIERFFDMKSEPKDSITVYCNGMLLTGEYMAPGQKFFGIDRQSFERTAFISGTEVKILSTGNINKKLNNFVEGNADESDFESAKSRLEAKIKGYKKARGEGGLIYDQTQKLNSIKEKKSDKQTIADNLVGKYEEYDRKKQQISAISKQIANAQSENVVFANWENYDRMVSEINLNKERIQKIEEKYPSGKLPSNDQLEKIGNDVIICKNFNARLHQKSFTDEDNLRYSGLAKKFAEGIPTDEEVSNIRDTINKESKCRFDLEAKDNVQLSEKEKMLMHKFAYRLPSEDEINRVKSNDEKYKTLETQLKDTSAFVSSDDHISENKVKNWKKPFIVVAIASAILLLSGILTLFFNLIVGVSLAVIGGVALVAIGFMYLNKKASSGSNGTMGAYSENPETTKIKERLSEINTEIQANLLPYGYSFENGVHYAVASYLDDIKNYKELNDKFSNGKSEVDKLKTQLTEFKSEIERFFAKYDIYADSYVERLTKLQSDINTFKSLTDRKENWNDTRKDLESKINETKLHINTFCEEYRINPEHVEEEIKTIKNDISEYTRLKKDITDDVVNAEKFKSEKGLDVRPEGKADDIKELNKQLSSLQDDAAKYYNQISDDEHEVDEIEELQGEYEEANELLTKYKADYKLLISVLECLDEADKSLKDKYIKPVKDRFLDYSSTLEKTLGEKIVMNANFEIRYEREGKERSDEHLSSGQRSLCALCFRLALIDNMYLTEKPFVILDDPFINLDDEHLVKAKELLKEIAKKMQIVYFACHPSRAI